MTQAWDFEIPLARCFMLPLSGQIAEILTKVAIRLTKEIHFRRVAIFIRPRVVLILALLNHRDRSERPQYSLRGV